LPLEANPFGVNHLITYLDSKGWHPILRKKDNQLVVTDSGHFVVDLSLGPILNPHELDHQLNSVIGILENGLFLNLVDQVFVGKADGSVEVLNNKKRTQ
jgi:ribose 5-phosphate isomerase A